MKTHEYIGQLMGALETARKQNRLEDQAKHDHTLRQFIRETAPYGAGLDKNSSTTKLIFHCTHPTASRELKVLTEHTIKVRPRFGLGFAFKISGLNLSNAKAHLETLFSDWLSSEVKGNVYVA